MKKTSFSCAVLTFFYDEVYDQLENKKEEEDESKKSLEEKEAMTKYMDNLLVTAKEREQEFERRQERSAQREREKEADMYADKENLVTSAFKRKKVKEIAEQEKALAKIEAMKNAYRRLCRQTFGKEIGQKAPIKVEETEIR